MREIIAKKGERTRVLHMLFDSIPQEVTFTAARLSGSGSAGGQVEVIGSKWMFTKSPRLLALEADQTFYKGFWDSNYAIFVTPDQDTRITFSTRHVTSGALKWALGGLLVLAVLSVLVMSVLNPG